MERSMNIASACIVRRLAWLTLCLATVSGCATWNLKKSLPWPLGDEKAGKPDRIVASWTDTVLYQPNQPPVRGFGGRLMFYEGQKEKPVKADGTLVVYAFDETGRASADARPDKKYVFPPDQLALHYSKSNIGHSYSVWIPWDAVGGPQKDISLLTRFEPTGGSAVVVGKPARQLLPGAAAPGQDASQLAAKGVIRAPTVQPADAAVQQASYNAAAPQPLEPVSPESPARRMMTATIPIPTEMACGPLPPSQAVPASPTTAATGFAQNPMVQGFATAPRASGVGATASTATALPPQAGYLQPRFRAPGESTAPTARDRALWSQRPATARFAPAPPPGSESGLGLPATQPTAGQATY
jgi:hypothetical protein